MGIAVWTQGMLRKQRKVDGEGDGNEDGASWKSELEAQRKRHGSLLQDDGTADGAQSLQRSSTASAKQPQGKEY